MLQVWIELGAVGAIRGLLVTVLIFTRIGSLPYATRIAARELFVTTIVIACSETTD